MADGGRVGEFPQKIIGDQRLPLRVVLDECLDMSLQEIGGDRHLSLLVHLRVAVRSEDRSCRNVHPLPRDESIKHAQYTPVSFFTTVIGAGKRCARPGCYRPEAAVATGGVWQQSSLPAPAVFHADHPFLFLILAMDRQDGSAYNILFMGRVVAPKLLFLLGDIGISEQFKLGDHRDEIISRRKRLSQAATQKIQYGIGIKDETGQSYAHSSRKRR